MTPSAPIEEQPQGAGTSPPAPAADPAELARQIADLKEQVAENQRTAQYWAERARATAPEPAHVRVEPEPEEDDTDVLEAITTEGTKGFDRLAEKRGFVKKADVAAMIEARATSLTKEQELIERYPDLRQKNSDFFKATAAHYGELVKSGTPAVLAMELASEKAELDFMRSGKLKPEAPKDDGDRRTRAAAASGAPSRRPAANEPDDDELSPDQKRIAAAMGISEEAYLKRAKAGVNVGGRPGARR
jgi:hypothetical protein